MNPPAAVLQVPAGLQVLVEHQVWARLEPDGSATVGITALGIHLAGEIYMCRPKPAGSEVRQGRAVAVVELAKSIVAVKSPLSGRVLAANPILADAPERVHADPYGSGWLVRLQPADLAAEQAALASGAALAAAMAQHAWLHRLA